MIIDPIVNRLDPAPQPHCSGILMTGTNTKRDEVDIRGETSLDLEELPPPYTEIDLERGIIEGPETPYSSHNHIIQFCRFHLHHHVADLDAEVRPSGMQKIEEGAKDIYHSMVHATESSFLALGAWVEGVGKIIYGIGMIIKQHHALGFHQDN